MISFEIIFTRTCIFYWYGHNTQITIIQISTKLFENYLVHWNICQYIKCLRVKNIKYQRYFYSESKRNQITTIYFVGVFIVNFNIVSLITEELATFEHFWTPKSKIIVRKKVTNTEIIRRTCCINIKHRLQLDLTMSVFHVLLSMQSALFICLSI